MKIQLSLLALASVAVAGAQTVVPNHLANAEGNTGFAFLVEGNSSRVYQTLIAANQLTDLQGKDLASVAWRLNADALGWPAATGTMSSFEIRLGKAVAPSAVSGTYANNFVGASTLVRSGSLTLDAGSLPGGANPQWGPDIKFDTPYKYTGGNLLIEYRFTGMPMGSGQPVLDAVTTGDPGLMTDYSASWGFLPDTALSFGSAARVIVQKFNAAPVPEPATMGVLGFGALALLRKRKK